LRAIATKGKKRKKKKEGEAIEGLALLSYQEFQNEERNIRRKKKRREGRRKRDVGYVDQRREGVRQGGGWRFAPLWSAGRKKKKRGGRVLFCTATMAGICGRHSGVTRKKERKGRQIPPFVAVKNNYVAAPFPA